MSQQLKARGHVDHLLKSYLGGIPDDLFQSLYPITASYVFCNDVNYWNPHIFIQKQR